MKRDLFAELKEGFQELEAQRQGKLTLRGQEARLAPVAAIDAGDLLALRERLNLSRAVFAMYLRTNPRTLENWEQGRARPNAQAATLIRLIERYPDTLERLAGL
ncbi:MULTISPECIES: helix-turn-helix domain-containing protein [Alloalcanivorax]|jgi:putative transcriptional regulator|uniref:Antitoxin HigA-2 n=1 Tax=Alloalcanivorax profundimaris TaxID=2735259 RepID=A0ABS0AT36_9GAMM|nr:MULTISPECIES: transcriptional regulator [Alloalcanivorax]MAO59661.1 transcriptional regulator [Alcanivorax sp.]MBM1144702.1 transcriptional regulator [Alcanivorax sp. ZXX171]MCQ6261326.1 transcriptional regulator [Alcanivorax sp. MM125-6]QJX03054.1 transcriptional regulator [Alcanivorax sp. IO_7]UWN51331.1 Antitoxin HigA-2 [Alcanivorax sp. ALC70]|tara:strand:+ start:38661 stop:38972 length:312 start_codon:yes stop_codon:yes gene_type:complete